MRCGLPDVSPLTDEEYSSRNSIQSSIRWKEEQTPLQLFPISLEHFLHIFLLLSLIMLLVTVATFPTLGLNHKGINLR